LKDWFASPDFSSAPLISVDIQNHPDQELVIMVMMMMIGMMGIQQVMPISWDRSSPAKIVVD
jgi:hypothetical protein